MFVIIKAKQEYPPAPCELIINTMGLPSTFFCTSRNKTRFSVFCLLISSQLPLYASLCCALHVNFLPLL